MDWLRTYLPWTDLAGLRRDALPRDLGAALAVAFLAVPQGIAYALIAGIPPAMGLYAATLPTVVGSMMRSSRHVVTGPTNAVSLLVGSAVATHQGLDPAEIAVTLALMVAVFQIAAGLLRLGLLVDFISHPVVVGYITGAGVLIGVGQLHNITGTEGGHGHLFHRLTVWVAGLGETDPLAVGVALGTAASMLVIRRIHPRLPAAILTMSLAIAATVGLGLEDRLATIASLSPIEPGLPALTLGNLEVARQLVPVAVAIALISVVESTSVARAIATRSGQRLDLSVEFTGEGLANLCSSFIGGYPTTGSLSRSALNEREGATSRLSGTLSGVLVLLAVMTLGPVLNHTPIASLAGLLLVVAAGLIDIGHIRELLRSHSGDRFAFLATLAGAAWELDKAIYLGVGISLVMFLRRARLLSIRDLAWDNDGRLREASVRTREVGTDGYTQPGLHYCRTVHVLNLAGSLFFGSSGQLQAALDEVLHNPNIEVLVLRIKRARQLDITILGLLRHTAAAMRHDGRTLILVGIRPSQLAYLLATEADEQIGTDNLFPGEQGHWFLALEKALERAVELSGEHDHGCPLQTWLDTREQHVHR